MKKRKYKQGQSNKWILQKEPKKQKQKQKENIV